jgi:hypothetical protein
LNPARVLDHMAVVEENDYKDVVEMIDEVMQEWYRTGKKTRRNWWVILAGGKKGKARTIYGKTFPVLRAAQIRQGVTVTENAICRNKDEKPPRIKKTNRWPEK